ncbi:LacI family DNA-binding transcriptional regulator [Streptomyces sp. CA-111067]|uniref:LacI family DNA-binding transcriptional regulator n=1 Tax=Streptomyces sp. CA-111067 TaxID=3240046 RepID=UPI003D99AC41
MTIRDIAARAGVTKGAVSFALNGQPGVSEATRTRILKVAKDLGWQPNSAARALSSSKSGAVGLILARPARTLGAEQFFMQLISGIEAELSKRPIALVLQVVPDLEAEVAAYTRWWSERRVDGALLTDLRVEDSRVGVLRELGIPAVVFGGPGHHDGLPGVWSDETTAMNAVVEHLVGLDHRRVARVAGRREFLHTHLRDQAFQAAVEQYDLLDGSTVYTDFSPAEGEAATRQLLSADPLPSAIIFDNDVMAVAGARTAAELGLQIPRDLSVVAWDDSILCQLTQPPLTAVSRDIEAYGAHGARALLELIEGAVPDIDVQDHAPSLVVRKSTAKARTRP